MNEQLQISLTTQTETCQPLPLRNDPRPYSYSIPHHELVRHGLASDDPWMRRLAEIVEVATDHLGNNDTLEGLIEEWENDVSEANRATEYAEEAIEEEKQKFKELNITYKALKYDHNPTFQEIEINELKAQLVTATEEKNQTSNMNFTLRRNLETLQKEHDELTKKWNTWKIIST